MVSERNIRKLIEKQFKGDISQEYILYVQKKVDEYLSDLIENDIKDFNEINNFRKIQGLPILKRLHNKYFISKFVLNECELGQDNRDTNSCTEAIEVV